MTNLERLADEKQKELFMSLIHEPKKLAEAFRIPMKEDPATGEVKLSLEKWLAEESTDSKTEEIESFISTLLQGGTYTDVFSGYASYWFATILLDRFKEYKPVRFYNSYTGVFFVKIDERLYGTNGDITDYIDRNDSLIPWSYFSRQDPVAAKNIMKKVSNVQR